MPTKQELYDLAEEHGVDVPDGATKADIEEALSAAGVNVESNDTAAEDAPAAPGDPALFDPQSLAEAQAGTVNDPATRSDAEAEIEPAPAVGAQASETSTAPAGGDVEVALLPADDNAGEWHAPLNVEDWVVLDGSHDEVPDRLDGHIAYVVQSHSVPAPDSQGGPNSAQALDEDAPVTVRTRDEADALLVLPLSAIKEVGRGGRNALLPHG